MDKLEIIECVLAAQAGDRRAFGLLIEAYQGSVLAVATRRLGNFAEAQELTQEVFLHAMEKIPQLKQPECFGGWLRSIANRMAINRAVRSRNALSMEPEALAGTCVESRTPFDAAIDGERAEQLRDGLSRLRKMDRQTLEAFYIDGDSIDEMSHRFDSPIGTIKRRLHMARKRLAEELSGLAAV